MIKLRDIAIIQVGFYEKPSIESNAIYLQMSSFEGSGLLKNIKPSIWIEGKKCNALLQDGDLLFAAKGTNNFCAIYHLTEFPAVASSTFLTIRIKKDVKVLPEFVCWYLNLKSTLQYLAKEAKGTGIPSIAKSTLEELEVPIVSIETQQRIVKLDELQQKETRLQKQIMKKRQQIFDYKLKMIITNGTKNYTKRNQ